MSPKFSVVAAAFLALVACQLCFAQQQQPRANKFRNRSKPPQALLQSSAQATYGRVATPPDLPNLPAYTSGKFIFARQADVRRSNQKAIHLEYAINEHPSTVIAWYDSVLKQYGWKVNQKTDYSLYASRVKDGNAVNVFVDNTKAVGFRYRLNIAYKFFKPVDDEPNQTSSSNRSTTSATGSTTTTSR